MSFMGSKLIFGEQVPGRERESGEILIKFLSLRF